MSTSPPEPKKKKNLQSLPLMAGYGGKLDAGVSDINTASTELMSVTGEESLRMNLGARQQREGCTLTLCAADKKIDRTGIEKNGPSLMIPSEATNKPERKRSTSSCTES